MGVRKYLHEAAGVLTTARRRAELHKYSKDILYNLEVLIRACSRVGDMIEEEIRVKQIEESKIKLKAYQEKIFQAIKKAHRRAERKKKKIKSKPRTPKRTRKIAA